jgi:hypothetical protein
MERLLHKYLEIARLRRNVSAEPPTQAMRALAAEFPGALRELDQVPQAVLEARIAELEQVARGATPPAAWMLALVRFHELVLQETRTRTRAPGEHVTHWAIAQTAMQLGYDRDEVTRWVLP